MCIQLVIITPLCLHLTSLRWRNASHVVTLEKSDNLCCKCIWKTEGFCEKNANYLMQYFKRSRESACCNYKPCCVRNFLIYCCRWHICANSWKFCVQLLALTIQHEKPDLEEQKTKLLQQEEDKKIQLAKLEGSLLEVKYVEATSFTARVYFMWAPV